MNRFFHLYKNGPEYYTHIPFMQMVHQFADDDFYKLHYVAKKFLTLDAALLQIHLKDKSLV